MNKNIDKKIKAAVENIVPDVLSNVLSHNTPERGNIFIIQPRRKNYWIRGFGALAASLMLVVAGLFTSQWIDFARVNALVMLDVNPSIELSINRNNRVLKAAANNADGVKILDGMDFKDVPINIAIYSIVGSMLDHGYIHPSANSILISVESSDADRNALLQRNLTDSIGTQLNVVNGAVVSQNLSEDASIRQQADEFSISYGKAALVQKILADNAHLVFGDLAELPVNELVLLIGSKNIQADGMEAQGKASDTAYIGEEKAEQAALEHAGADMEGAKRLRAELDYDHGVMVYEVEFEYYGAEYEYEIDAKNGSVLEFDSEKGRGDSGEERKPSDNSAQTQDGDDFIGEDRAIEIAVSHSGVQSTTKLKAKLDKDDGLYIYEIEFESGRNEYDYEINAATGEIISWETED